MAKQVLPYKLGAALLSSLLFIQAGLPVFADDATSSSAATDGQASSAPVQAPKQSAQQLQTLVAPIALYPDSLLSQILVASTYPLELVQAYQWLQNNSALQGKDLTDAAAKQNWDASVQALVVFPDILKRLNQDVSWTTNLGNAFLAQQDDVMDAVQHMRTDAENAGKLKSSDKETVTNTTESGHPVVEIQPTDPQVVYVPVYDPNLIWGPPYYYSYPGWYYPPVYPGYYWGWDVGISLGFFYAGWGGWGGWGWHPYWYGHRVVVNNVFIQRYHYNTVLVTNVNGRAVWAHDPAHRMGVAYPSRALAQHYYANSPRAASFVRPMASPRLNAAAVQTRMQAAAIRAQNAPMEHIGSRQIPASGYYGSHTAFGGVGAGGSIRSYSNRGNGSLGSRSHGSYSGGGHGGGGWGGGGGGGGGGGHH